jgi:hypothetical protein
MYWKKSGGTVLKGEKEKEDKLNEEERLDYIINRKLKL